MKPHKTNKQTNKQLPNHSPVSGSKISCMDFCGKVTGNYTLMIDFKDEGSNKNFENIFYFLYLYYCIFLFSRGQCLSSTHIPMKV